MTEQQFFDDLSAFVTGKKPLTKWWVWWKPIREEVREMIGPPAFRRLAPVAIEDDPSVLEKTLKEAVSLLKKRGIKCSVAPEVTQQFQEQLRKRGSLEFFSAIGEIGKSECQAGSWDKKFQQRLVNAYAKDGAPADYRAWLKDGLQKEFRSIGSRPRWIDEPQWPVHDGQPATFVAQLTVPASEMMASQDELYVFVRRTEEGAGTYRITYEIVTQTPDDGERLIDDPPPQAQGSKRRRAASKKVDLAFRSSKPGFGDLYRICGDVHPKIAPTGEFGFETLANLGFKQVDDYFAIVCGGAPVIWVSPTIKGRVVEHHPGPFDGLRLDLADSSQQALWDRCVERFQKTLGLPLE